MNQADVSKLVSKLRFMIQPKHRRLRNPGGSEGRLNNIGRTVTALMKYERIELYHDRADEARGYAERVSDPYQNESKRKIFLFSKEKHNLKLTFSFVFCASPANIRCNSSWRHT